MLEYSKTILSKVSFDRALFDKELAKAIQLIGEQLQELKNWCYQTFSHQYPLILHKHFFLH